MADESTNTPQSNNDKDITFETPSTTVSEPTLSETTNIEFEKYKMKMNFLKWVLGTFAVAIMTIIINWGFKDRAVGMNEISQYDKYTTDLLVLNDNPIKKRMLAQFFSTVTPSNKLKCGWKEYYTAVNKDYERFIKADSLIRINFARMPKDTTKMTPEEKAKYEEMRLTIKKYDSIKSAPTIIPEGTTALLSTTAIKTITTKPPTVYLHYSNNENAAVIKDYEKILKINNWNVPQSELVKKKYPSVIKYFHSEDKNLAEQINKLLDNKFTIVPNLEYSNNVKNRQLEIWINNN